MRNIQDFLETLKLSFNSAFSICMNVPLRLDSHLLKNFCVMLFISDEKCFFFIFKSLFVLEILKFVYQRFGLVGKTARLGR